MLNSHYYGFIRKCIFSCFLKFGVKCIWVFGRTSSELQNDLLFIHLLFVIKTDKCIYFNMLNSILTNLIDRLKSCLMYLLCKCYLLKVYIIFYFII